MQSALSYSHFPQTWGMLIDLGTPCKRKRVHNIRRFKKSFFSMDSKSIISRLWHLSKYMDGKAGPEGCIKASTGSPHGTYLVSLADATYIIYGISQAMRARFRRLHTANPLVASSHQTFLYRRFTSEFNTQASSIWKKILHFFRQ